MPRYDYQCDACGKVTEMAHGFEENAGGEPCLNRTCPGSLVRVFPVPVVHYKGYGFYRTDNRDAGERYSFDHFDGSGTNAEEKAMSRRIKHPESTIPKK